MYLLVEQDSNGLGLELCLQSYYPAYLGKGKDNVNG